MEEQTFKICRWLYPLSWIYGLIVEIRNKCFDWGMLPSHSFDIPVIGIGNLAAGGTGKTPHTEYLVGLLSSMQYRIAVLSRGYKRKTKGYVVATSSSTARSIGDEPYQMHVKYPSITVAVDEDRVHGIKKLQETDNPTVEVVLLDDSFQHRYVKPGLNILLTDYHRLFCDDVLLPAGRLREPVVGKERAHIVIVTKCPDTIKPIDFNIIAKRLNLYPYQRLYFSSLCYGNMYPLFPQYKETEADVSKLSLEALSEMDVLLVTGIAHPSLLQNKLSKKAKHLEVLAFADHHSYTSRDIQTIGEHFAHLKGEKRIIVTTEKDAARLVNAELNDALKSCLYVLPVEVKILQDRQDDFNKHILNYVRESARNRSVSKKTDVSRS